MITILVLEIVDVQADRLLVVIQGGCRRGPVIETRDGTGIAPDHGTTVTSLSHRLTVAAMMQESGTDFEEAEQDPALASAVQTWFRCDHLIRVIVLRALVRTAWWCSRQFRVRETRGGK